MADFTVDATANRKKRSSNFSDVEKAAIREGFVGFGDLLGKIFANKVGGNTKVQQDNAWMKITQAVNAVGRAFRTVDEVKAVPRVSLPKKMPTPGRLVGVSHLPVPDDTTLAIIQDMKGTPAFSGIPGSSASESAIVAVNRQDEPQKDPFNLLGFDALTGSPSRTWSMFEVACSSGEAGLDDIEGTETKVDSREYTKDMPFCDMFANSCIKEPSSTGKRKDL
ncbi:hypothetical protein MAR_032588 [Mya arenaria]|uniref:Myb/SANT-like domain-containing protein n=1 Tax=Mya arenaria TaxID=6604 RepID=A0ABY7FA18_MYAAR|nr:hypothetical protein MAR_032588 [Mya arenaria]